MYWFPSGATFGPVGRRLSSELQEGNAGRPSRRASSRFTPRSCPHRRPGRHVHNPQGFHPGVRRDFVRRKHHQPGQEPIKVTLDIGRSPAATSNTGRSVPPAGAARRTEMARTKSSENAGSSTMRALRSLRTMASWSRRSTTGDKVAHHKTPSASRYCKEICRDKAARAYSVNRSGSLLRWPPRPGLPKSR
jgi:hypothetical protein